MIGKRPRGGLRHLLLAGLVAWAGGSCGDGGGPFEPGPPVERPGELVVTLTSGDGAAALRFRLTGGEIGPAEAADPALTVYSHASDGALHVAVFGDLSGGDVLRFDVPDVEQLDSYAAAVVEVADAENVLIDETWFELSVRR